VPGIIISKIIGFLVFLIILAIANYLKVYITNEMYYTVIDFIIDNLWLSFLIFIATMIAEVFWVFSFPFNLPAPILSAISSVFIVSYIYRMWILVEGFTTTKIVIPIWAIYPLVFWIVLIVGYISIFLKLSKKKIKEKEVRKIKRKKRRK
jgi:hypothetical protein